MVDVADCSIVILAHNGAEVSGHCLRSLLAARVRPREVVFVDQASTDETPALAAAMGAQFAAAGIGWISWRNAENLGCSAARNAAWERASGEYVMFLDNDAAVCTGDYLTRLIATMRATPRLGVLGPKLIYPFAPHPIQCAGVAINRLGRVRFRGRGAARGDARYAVPATVPALISACWLMPRRFLTEIGGLDPLFHPVQYEDLDFCLRVNAAGYHCAYTPEVEMYHFEGSTTAAGGAASYQRVIAANSAKFRQKWQAVLRGYPADDEEEYRWLRREEMGLGATVELGQT